MHSCKAQWILLAVIVGLGTPHLLASCGQKGELFLPAEDPPEERR